VCSHCGANGTEPVCAKFAGGFHVFEDEAITPQQQQSEKTLDVTDMPTHILNLDAPPEQRWAHILPKYTDAVRALFAVVQRQVTRLDPSLHFILSYYCYGQVARRPAAFSALLSQLAVALQGSFEFSKELNGIAATLGYDMTSATFFI
jgi:hypothetical protein